MYYNVDLTFVFIIAEKLRRFVNVFEAGSLFFLAELLLVACSLCVEPQRFFFFFDLTGKFIFDFEVQKNSSLICCKIHGSILFKLSLSGYEDCDNKSDE